MKNNRICLYEFNHAHILYSVRFAEANIWNSIPVSIYLLPSLQIFKYKLVKCSNDTIDLSNYISSIIDDNLSYYIKYYILHYILKQIKLN